MGSTYSQPFIIYCPTNSSYLSKKSKLKLYS